MNNSLASIVIPVYNGENYLREAIDSALRQTYDRTEVIVVNDGSTDGTERICRSYGDRIRYIEKENGGVASAINLGIRNMNGDYFSWLSHDDIYYPQKLQQQMECLADGGDAIAIVHGNYDLLNETYGNVSHVKNDLAFTKERLCVSVFPVLMNAIHACVPLIHRSHFERVGLLDESLEVTQDIDFLFRAMRGQRTLFISEPLVRVRIHSRMGHRVATSFHQSCAKQYASFADALTGEEIANMFPQPAAYYYHVACFLAASGMEKEAARFRARAELAPKDGRQGDLLRILGQLTKEPFREICIFGMGIQGKLLYQELSGRGVQVYCFGDNVADKEGGGYYGIPCLTPEKLAAQKEGHLVIISPDDSSLIQRQLKNFGISNILTKRQLEMPLLKTIPQTGRPTA